MDILHQFLHKNMNILDINPHIELDLHKITFINIIETDKKKYDELHKVQHKYKNMKVYYFDETKSVITLDKFALDELKITRIDALFINIRNTNDYKAADGIINIIAFFSPLIVLNITKDFTPADRLHFKWMELCVLYNYKAIIAINDNTFIITHHKHTDKLVSVKEFKLIDHSSIEAYSVKT